MKKLTRVAFVSLLSLLPLLASRAAEGGVSGKVVETMDSGGYTYVLLDTGSAKVWVAAHPFKVAVGEKVTVGSAMEMQNFQSPTLKRTFDRIYFASSVAVGTNVPAAGKLPAGHPPLDTAHGSMSAGHGAAAAPVGAGIDGTVVETMDVGVYTYVKVKTKDAKEVWAAASKLAVKVGDQVTIPPGELMTDFHSAKLNRTFAEIYFVSTIAVKSPAATP